jgi:hypothetical protein
VELQIRAQIDVPRMGLESDHCAGFLPAQSPTGCADEPLSLERIRPADVFAQYATFFLESTRQILIQGRSIHRDGWPRQLDRFGTALAIEEANMGGSSGEFVGNYINSLQNVHAFATDKLTANFESWISSRIKYFGRNSIPPQKEPERQPSQAAANNPNIPLHHYNITQSCESHLPKNFSILISSLDDKRSGEPG